MEQKENDEKTKEKNLERELLEKCLDTLQTYYIAKEKGSDTRKIETMFKSFVFNLFFLIEPKMRKSNLTAFIINNEPFTFSELADFYSKTYKNYVKDEEEISFSFALEMFRYILLFLEYTKKE
jgi:hypothetical protein